MNDVELTIERIPNGAKVVSILTETEPKLLKKSRITGLPCPFKSVIRKVWRNGMIGASYANAVNNQREREEHDELFISEPIWNGKGQYVSGSKRIVEHIEKGERYLAFFPRSTIDNVAIVSDDIWEADGIEIEPNELEEYLPTSTFSSRQETEKAILWRIIKLDSIKAIRFASQTITFV